MKQITIADTIGALCSDDYKGINNQYVGQGKVVIIESICGSTIRRLGGSAESRTTTGFRWKYGGGTENIVSEEKECDIRNSKESDINGALQAGAKQNVNLNNVVRQQYAVRRLMPIECERLQGLPDNYTFLPGEKCCSDSARYKALGNGMCQNCADFVIRRIVEEVEKEKPEVMFLAGCVDEILTVLEKHKFVGNTDGIIMKTLECASYQKWQETKAEAWGKNNNAPKGNTTRL